MSGSEKIARTKGQPMAEAWEAMRERVDGTLVEHGRGGILAYEKPVISGGKLKNQALLLLIGFEVFLVWTAARRGWTVLFLYPSQLKKFATGNGRAEKDEVIRYAAKFKSFASLTSHEADAITMREWAAARRGAR